ncbi:MAG: hypothetical protein GXY32_04700 [Ruminococcaceae bacterium]|nr:hypothetical protein [Oscillospiraceae bacterium]
MVQNRKNGGGQPYNPAPYGIYPPPPGGWGYPLPPRGGKKGIRTVLLLLFILSFFTLYLALALAATSTSNTNTMVENMWMFFLPLPIPLASLILGIIYKRKGYKATKNIVVGIIFTVLLVLYGSFSFVFSDMYSHDFSYVDRISTKIGFDLPDKGDIATQDWTTGVQTAPNPDTVRYLASSDITFADKAEISAFNAEILKSEQWLTTVNTTLIGLVPSLYSYLPASTQYDTFMIYNTDLKTYNTMPERSGTYKYIFIAYNSVEGTMKVGEYSLAVHV